MSLPIHALISPSYRQEFPASYREMLLETCQEFDRACTRDIVRIYASADQEPELSIGTHIDRMLALESALEDEDSRIYARRCVYRDPEMHVSNALCKVQDNLRELAGLIVGGAA